MPGSDTLKSRKISTISIQQKLALGWIDHGATGAKTSSALRKRPAYVRVDALVFHLNKRKEKHTNKLMIHEIERYSNDHYLH